MNSKEKMKEYSVPKHNLSLKDKMHADDVLRLERFKRLNEMNESSRIYAELLRLKYEITDYLELGVFSEDHSFGEYLKKYVRIFNISRRQLAANLSIHETKFSRLINNKENPGLNVLYRLEEHSNGLLKAELIWKLVTSKIEEEIRLDKKERKVQSKRVKNKFEYRRRATMTNT